MNRAELIASLVTDKFSGFKDGDEPLLEAASDARLGELRAAANAAKVAVNDRQRLETDLKNTQARLKVAEDRIKASETELPEAEFLARAPAKIKTLVEAHQAQEAQRKASLISALKSCGVMTEEELKKKDIPELETLTRFARVQVVDFSGRGLPVERNAEDKTVSYAPPDPYAAGIRALQAAK